MVGFENHAAAPGSAMACARSGECCTATATTARDGGEGVVAGRIVGTYIHGPLLPKNPALADVLVAEALRRRSGAVDLEPLDDRLEHSAHDVAVAIAAG